MNKFILRLVGLGAIAVVSSTAARALTVQDVTYTLSESLSSSTATTETWQMVLDITGGASDGRTDVTSLAFNAPSGYVSAAMVSAPGGGAWTASAGGLNSSGCNGTGNFYCFSGYAAATDSMEFVFNVTGGVGSFAAYAPDFKIDWNGSLRNYDLVSQPLTATPPVPEPQTYALMLAGLGAIGFMARRRRQA